MKRIEYFYAAYSGYAYIGSALFARIAEEAGALVVHRPFFLGSLVAARGNDRRVREEIYGAYWFGREIERWAEYRNVPIRKRRPTHHHESYDMANRMLIANGETDPGTSRLAHGFLEAHWLRDADLSDRETLITIAGSAGIDGAALFAAAGADATALRQRENTDEAIARGFFGSPTYVVDGDPFYGQDRLELVARALEKPFADDWVLPG